MFVGHFVFYLVHLSLVQTRSRPLASPSIEKRLFDYVSLSLVWSEIPLHVCARVQRLLGSAHLSIPILLVSNSSNVYLTKTRVSFGRVRVPCAEKLIKLVLKVSKIKQNHSKNIIKCMF